MPAISDTDTIESQLDHAELTLRLHGPDRPHLIAAVTGALHDADLYVESLAFNLRVQTQRSQLNPYSMEIHAKGSARSLEGTHSSVSKGEFLKGKLPPMASQPLVPWDHSPQVHFRLHTPDRPGITAVISDLVGNSAKAITGNFVHLMAATHNDGGPHGGTPYFMIRANVAVANAAVGNELSERLKTFAKNEGFQDDLTVFQLG